MNQEDILKNQLEEELTREGYDQLYLIFIADFLAVIFYASLLWGKISNHILLIVWVLIMFLFNDLVRLIIIRIYYAQKKEGKPQNLVFWKNYFNIINIQSGFLWALGGFLFIYVPDQSFRLLIFVYLTAILGTALSKLMVYTLSYIGFMTPICILLLVISVSIFQPYYSIFLFLATLLYIAVTVFTVAHAHKLLINSIKLKIYNTNILETLRRSEENFRNTIDSAPIGTALLSPDGKYQHINRTMHDLLGYTDEELQNMTMEEITHADDAKTSIDIMNKLLQGEIKIAHLEKRYIRKDGGVIWALVSVSLLRDEQGNPKNFIVQIIDVSDRIQNEKRMIELNKQTLEMLNELKQLEHEENLLNKLNSMLQVCLKPEEAYPRISIIAEKLFPELNGGLSVYIKVNQNIETVLQWGKEKLLQNFFLPADCFGIRGGITNTVDDPNISVPCAHYLSPPQGGYMSIPLIVQNELIGVIHILASKGKAIPKHLQELAVTFSNIIKLALANINLRESLHELSMRDQLTGLYNRRYLTESLTRELLRIVREKTTLCTAMLDIDDFKKFNDTLGHAAGDEVLKFIGNMLKNNFRSSDIACRFGGEEFVVIMIRSDAKDAAQRMNHFRETIQNSSLFYQGKLLPSITISIGIAEAPQHGISVEDLLKAADTALYQVKRTGKNKVEIYHSKS